MVDLLRWCIGGEGVRSWGEESIAHFRIRQSPGRRPSVPSIEIWRHGSKVNVFHARTVDMGNAVEHFGFWAESHMQKTARCGKRRDSSVPFSASATECNFPGYGESSTCEASQDGPNHRSQVWGEKESNSDRIVAKVDSGLYGYLGSINGLWQRYLIQLKKSCIAVALIYTLQRRR